MFNIGICDDDLRILNTIENLTNKFCKENKIKTEISHFQSGEEFCRRGRMDQVDILFLDIKMDGLTGMDVAAELRKVNQHTRLVFVTSYDEYAPDLFSYDTSDFIKKPIEEDRFNAVFRQVSQKLIRKGKKFYYKVDKVERNVLKDNVLFFESDAHKVIIHKMDRTEEKFRSKLIEVGEVLSTDEFLRVGKSYIVNLDKIETLSKTQIVMIDGSAVPISRSFRAEVMKAYLKFRENKSRGW